MPKTSTPPADISGPGRRDPTATPTMLAGLGLVVGCWALLPPYTGPALDTAARVEFVDHVVPGIVVLAISTLTFILGRREGATAVLFPAGLGIVLAGFWMCATHLPLVLQATRQEVPWGTTVYHSLPGVAVLALGAAWAFTFRTLVEEDS